MMNGHPMMTGDLAYTVGVRVDGPRQPVIDLKFQGQVAGIGMLLTIDQAEAIARAILDACKQARQFSQSN